MGYSDQTIGYDYGISGTSRKLPRPTTAGKPRPTKRDRGHIEGDIKAATRQLEKLQAELAATPPKRLALDSLYASYRKVAFTHEGGEVFIHIVYEGIDKKSAGVRVPASTLQAWLNYHFPEAS